MNTTTTHLKPIATNCDTYSGLQRCNELEKIIKHAYKEYQSEMMAMGNDIYSDNKENIIRLIERQQVYGESIADQYIDDMMDEHMRPDQETDD